MGNKWDKLNEKLKDMSSKWDKLNKELDDALEEEFGLEEPKQETLEEAAINCWAEGAWDNRDDFTDGFVEGAKWQQERMYSEEIDLINWLQQSLTAKKFYSTDAEDLLEQFKKK
jgi:hypothetical protein